MNTLSISAGTAPHPAPKPLAATRPPAAATTHRRFSLAEAVRELAGWTPPIQPPPASRQPEGWQLA